MTIKPLKSIMHQGGTIQNYFQQPRNRKILNPAYLCLQKCACVYMSACVCVRERKEKERETLSAMGGVNAAAFREGKQS